MYAKIKPLIKLKKELNILDYTIPKNLKLQIGQLVEIPFRNRNIYGIIFDITKDTKQSKNILKSINKIIINTPLFSNKQINFYNFFVEYNLSSLNFLNKITPLPLKRKIQIKKNEMIAKRINWKVQKISNLILKNKKFIFKHTYFSEKISLIKKAIDQNNKQTLIISPTKLHLKKIYSYLLNFYKASDIIIITGNTHLNKNKNNEIWHNIQKNRTKIILGTKISIFYPMHNLNSIIIDEIENENHNQIDINPRFEFLTNIMKLSEINNCQLILTTYAPPSKLYYLAQKKKIKLLETKTNNRSNINILEMNLKYFSNQIHFNTEEEINYVLKNKGKILLLVNKKGFAKKLYCPNCHYIFKCPNCNNIPSPVKNYLYCYNCQKQIKIPLKCPNCNNLNLKTKGVGSTQLLSKIKKSFPRYQSILIDKDHKKNLKLIEKNNIIIATKLILNYLDEKKFDLIVLPLAQQFLNNNFDAHEKFYQFCSRLLSFKSQKLIIQTLNDLKIYTYIQNQNYFQMIKEELKLRKLFKYPPYYKIITITIKDKNKDLLEKKAQKIHNELQKNINQNIEISEIIQPQKNKTYAFYLKNIMIKYQKEKDIQNVKKIFNKIDIIYKN